MTSSLLRVARATVADAATAAALFDAYRQFYAQPADLATARAFIGERLARGDSWIALAWQGDAAVGLCQCYPLFSSTAPRPGPAPLLNDLYVVPEARGSGAAQALMQAAEAHARATGCVAMELSTARSNTRAQALYTSQGWVRDEVFFVYGKTLAS
ncbi:MAG: GNAT family N-acetyltransferase [Proteobacteria bacterium]|nr:GNAT family N-acetyltransferase [Pseudomonadota bacterium]